MRAAFGFQLLHALEKLFLFVQKMLESILREIRGRIGYI